MDSKSLLPKEKGLDHTLSLISEGYLFIPNRRDYMNSDIFQTRLLGQKAICMSGKEAAELFYNDELFVRKGAAPKRVQKTLFGESAIQTMDGENHKQRKRMFLSLMTPDRLKQLQELTKEEWERKAQEMDIKKEAILMEETEEVICRLACRWAGVPLEENEVKHRARDFALMIDSFGGVGERYREGKRARGRTEKWIENIIKNIRSRKLNPCENTAAYIFSFHRDLKGKLMSDHMAAIELINIVRPMVAVGRFITFGALALHEHPEVQEKLKKDPDEYGKMFIQEVRRYYPFAPFTGARVKKDFSWQHYHFKKGTLVMLDIYGTNHHPDLWDDPAVFNPERFVNWNESPFNFIPQGGGDHYMGHRCAGEWVTLLIMKESLNFLANKMVYDVPAQDLSYSMARMPAMPKSGFIMHNIQTREID